MNMKYTSKKVFAVIFTILFAFALFPQPAIAAGSAGISLSKSSVTVGNSFSATLSFSGGGSYVAGVQAYIKYDSSLIQYVSASGDGDATVSGGNGSIVLETTSTSKSSLSIKLTFKALAVGSASISITSSDVVDWDGNTVGNATASKSVTIKTPASPSPSPSKTQTQEPVETETPPKTTEIEQAIKTDIDGTTFYLWRDLSNVTLPEGFVATNYTYKSEAIQAGTSQKMGFMLLYVTDSEGLNGKFYIYDEKTDTFSKYITMSFAADEYTILGPDKSVSIPAGYKETTHVIDGEKITAWEIQNGDTFFLIYAKNGDGVAGFYSYDTYEGTLQRFNQATVKVEEEPLETSPAVNANASGDMSNRGVFERLLDDEQVLAITAVLAGIIIILIAIIVSILLSRKKKAMLSALKPYSPEESDAEESSIESNDAPEAQTSGGNEEVENTESVESKTDNNDINDTNNF
jgi:hypothetical protein